MKPSRILTTKHVAKARNGDTLTLGGRTFTFRDRSTWRPGDVQIVRYKKKGPDEVGQRATLANLIAAVNAGPPVSRKATKAEEAGVKISRELRATRVVALRMIEAVCMAVGTTPTETPRRILASLVRAEMRKGDK